MSGNWLIALGYAFQRAQGPHIGSNELKEKQRAKATVSKELLKQYERVLGPQPTLSAGVILCDEYWYVIDVNNARSSGLQSLQFTRIEIAAHIHIARQTDQATYPR